MLKHFLKALTLAVFAITSFTSCTVSEPSTPSGDPSNLRLKSVTSSGIITLNVEYDSQNRITEINFAEDSKYEFTYNGSSRIPSTFIWTEYNYEYVNDKYVKVVTETDTWTDIEANANGYITQYKCQEAEYRYNVEYDYTLDKYVLNQYGPYYDNWTGVLTYDSAGHLIKSDNGAAGEITTLEWSNGLLIRSTDNDTEYPESIIYEYSDVTNVNGQWDPNNSVFGPLAITGFFGRAPEKFIKSEAYYHSGDLESYVQYAYSLMSNGLIKSCKYYDSEDRVEMILNFVYESVK